MAIHNLLTCSGFGDVTSWIASGDCMKGRIGIVILFFIFAIVGKWGGEEIGMNYSKLFSWLIGIGSYFLLITLFGNFKIAFVIGLVLGIVAGYGSGFIGFGSEDGGEDGY